MSLAISRTNQAASAFISNIPSCEPADRPRHFATWNGKAAGWYGNIRGPIPRSTCVG